MKYVFKSKKGFKDLVEDSIKHFDQRGETIYVERNVLKSVVYEGVPYIVKQFQTPHFINRIIYALIRPSKAKRSYDYSVRLNEIGVWAPKPIGYGIERGLLTIKKSYYISEHVRAEEVRDLMSGAYVNPILLDAVAKFIATMHLKGVLHKDLSPGNVLFQRENDGNYKFYLVDVNRMKFFNKPLGMNMAAKNFERLCFVEPILDSMISTYALYRKWNEEDFKLEVYRYCNRFKERTTMKAALRYARKNAKISGYLRNSLINPVFCYSLLRVIRKFLFFSSHKQRISTKIQKIYSVFIKQYDDYKIIKSE